MERKFRCPNCKKDFAMEWALDNHKQHCRQNEPKRTDKGS